MKKLIINKSQRWLNSFLMCDDSGAFGYLDLPQLRQDNTLNSHYTRITTYFSIHERRQKKNEITSFLSASRNVRKKKCFINMKVCYDLRHLRATVSPEMLENHFESREMTKSVSQYCSNVVNGNFRIDRRKESFTVKLITGERNMLHISPSTLSCYSRNVEIPVLILF